MDQIPQQLSVFGDTNTDEPVPFRISLFDSSIWCVGAGKLVCCPSDTHTFTVECNGAPSITNPCKRKYAAPLVIRTG